MTSRFTELCINCADPVTLAAFWAQALDYQIVEQNDELVTLGPRSTIDHATPGPPTITLARVPEPKTVKNRLHLDLRASDGDQTGEVQRLLDLGARRIDLGQGSEASWVTLTDPEGNEFCVLAGSAASS